MRPAHVVRKVLTMTPKDTPSDADEAMDAADEANGEGRSKEDPTNETEARYGKNESAA
jgi:hypothetical protein